MSSLDVSSGASSPLRLAANRRNAQKSTGPRSAAGKRRVALNALRRSLCPEELEKRLRTRGQDPREFRDLHRDLIAIFHPKTRATTAGVELLARTWWEKVCRRRAWVGPGEAPTADLDARLDDLMQCVVLIKRTRHEWWRSEMAAVLGRALNTPTAVRLAVEARLPLLGGKQSSRKYPGRPRLAALAQDFEALRKVVSQQNGG